MKLSHLAHGQWVAQSFERVARVAALVAFFALLLLVSLHARAQTPCSGFTWDDGAGFSQATSYASACAEFTTWFEAFGGGREVTSCSVSGASGSASVMNAGGVPGATAVWSGTATPAGCGDGGGTPEELQPFTEAQALSLLVYGFGLVVLLLGYRQGMSS